MRLLLPILLLLSSVCFGQTQVETHDFIHYDTLYDAGAVDFRLRISRPRNMFTAGHPDTASRAVLIHMGGKGETGTNYALLRSYGPHYWLYRTSGGSIDSSGGWDGHVYTHGGTVKHYPIIISAQYSTVNGDVKGDEATNLINFLLNTYRIKRNSVHLLGLSMGAFTWTGMLNWSATPGGNTPTLGEDGMKLIKSVVALQGQSDLWSSGTIGSTGSVYTNTGYQFAGHWAAKYGGKFFGLEGKNDERNVWRVQKNMNDSVAGSAYFSYMDGPWLTHCCWNQMYTPYRTSWKSTGSPLATNLATGGFPPNPNSMGTYREGDNIFTWSFKQGDTSFVGNSEPPITVVKPAMSEYKNAFLGSNGKVYSFTNNVMQPYVFGGDTTTVDVATGFNTIAFLDQYGYARVTTAGSFSPTALRVAIDTSGNPFNSNIAIFGTGAVGGGNIRPTFCTIKGDSSVWYWGDNHYGYFGGNRPIKPIQLSTGGLKFKKLAMGYYRIVGLTTSGQVYEWLLNGSTTPTQKTIPRPAIDIWVSQFDYAGCLIPDTIGSQTMGYPYVWGNAFSQWGGNTNYTQPTSVKTLWGVTTPIKSIAGSYHTTAYVDSLGNMYSMGENVQGEVGNGTQTVDKYTYPTQFNWSFNTGENMVTSPQQIGIGTIWKKVYGDYTLSFYRFAQDENDSLYFWGRDKALVSGRGYIIMQEASYPNVIDVTSPTMVTPISAIYQQYNFTNGTINAGSDQNISTTTLSLSGSATGLTVIANGTVNNGIPNLTPSISSYQWVKETGPSASISNPGSLSTTVTGVTPGNYTFRLIVNYSNGATQSDVMAVAATAPPAETSSFRLIVPRASKINRPY